MKRDASSSQPRGSGTFAAKVRALETELLSAATGSMPPVNLSIPRHAVITVALHNLAYASSHAGLSAPVVFKDGSRPPPFPLGSLASTLSTPPMRKDPIRIGLMSFRHPELDYLVDVYATRNKELAEQPTMAEEEATAFGGTIVLLRDVDLQEGGELWVYHTGLEPMVVGFYRAVVSLLRERIDSNTCRNLVIRTRFYAPRGKDSALGEDPALLTLNSPGAQDSNYRLGPTWF